jgi:hypothetical protein
MEHRTSDRGVSIAVETLSSHLSNTSLYGCHLSQLATQAAGPHFVDYLDLLIRCSWKLHTTSVFIGSLVTTHTQLS